jgi:1,3-beta-glucan synthase
MFFIFIALVVGPIVAGPKVSFHPNNSLLETLMQPTGFNNNDTISSQTGTALENGGATQTDGSTPSSTDSGSSQTSAAGAKFRVMI